MPSSKKKAKAKTKAPQAPSFDWEAEAMELQQLKEKVQLLIDYVTAPEEMPESQKVGIAERLKGHNDG